MKKNLAMRAFQDRKDDLRDKNYFMDHMHVACMCGFDIVAILA